MENHSMLRLTACCLSAAMALVWSQTNAEKSTASLEGKVLNKTSTIP
jgi:hypothetical protein